MGFDLYCLREQNTIVTRISGSLEDAGLVAHLINLKSQTTGMQVYRSLSDCREITDVSRMTTEATTIAADLEVEKPDCLFAILVPPDNQVIFGLARAFQTFTEEKYKEVKIFTDFDEAVNWLSNDGKVKEMLLSVIESYDK